ncbi:hypothetical protein D3C72_1685350 [compost metagenome]
MKRTSGAASISRVLRATSARPWRTSSSSRAHGVGTKTTFTPSWEARARATSASKPTKASPAWAKYGCPALGSAATRSSPRRLTSSSGAAVTGRATASERPAASPARSRIRLTLFITP